ncbi:hypothetical protein EHR04_06215 [Leptospira levettii]|uniref:hypothetical protein n=1 Tax=Leptospira levettii TaxID=2023178 RepID=UPI0010837A7D|nr:hypothetical protein [Leptospira levettii]MCG6150027.1 hypothetical protein [Leptospira levettii]TGM26714.1 hypothetical protein EHQ74_09685 [Leptospira levettii]TGM75188.1 hypothetical protein EHR04_06215 [Leptospira levettii]TGM85788.1 hypothetical protein EHR00_02430 [Leptospira levettii]TGM91483.1 hypothetical protein EHR02_01245 [Leptospira levettii]
MRTLVTFSFALMVLFSSTAIFAEDCFLCGNGSTNGCQQCRGKDRKACEEKGCKISGTASCSTAANVKVCQSNRVYSDLTFGGNKKQVNHSQLKIN